MARFFPNYIALPPGRFDPEQRCVFRDIFGIARSDTRMILLAGQYLSNLMESQADYSLMISEFKEWTQYCPEYETAEYKDYWSNGDHWRALRLLERHHICIARSMDPDNDLTWEAFMFSTDFRGFASRREAVGTAHAVSASKQAAQSRESALAIVYEKEGKPQEQSAVYATQAMITLASVMNDKRAAPSARVTASNSILERAFGKPQRYLPVIECDIQNMSYRDGVAFVIQQTMTGKLSIEDAERVCNMFVIREQSKIEELAATLEEIKGQLANRTIDADKPASSLDDLPYLDDMTNGGLSADG